MVEGEFLVIFHAPDAAGNVWLTAPAQSAEPYRILQDSGGSLVPGALGKILGPDARLNRQTYALLAAIALRTLESPDGRLLLDDVVRLRGWMMSSDSAKTRVRNILNPTDGEEAFAEGNPTRGWRSRVKVALADRTTPDALRTWLWPEDSWPLPRFPSLHQLFYASTLPIWMADKDLNISYFNPAMEALIGEPLAPLLGTSGSGIFLRLQPLVRPDYALEFMATQVKIEQELRDRPHSFKGQRLEHRIPCLSAQGVECALIAHADVLFDEANRFTGTIVYIFRDDGPRPPHVDPPVESFGPKQSSRRPSGKAT